MIRKAVLPKLKIIRGILGEVLDLDAEDPAVQRALIFVLFPCMMLIIAPRDLRKLVVPAVDSDLSALIEQYTQYVMAGLQGLRDTVAKAKSASCADQEHDLI